MNKRSCTYPPSNNSRMSIDVRSSATEPADTGYVVDEHVHSDNAGFSTDGFHLTTFFNNVGDVITIGFELPHAGREAIREYPK